MQHIAEKKNIE